MIETYISSIMARSSDSVVLPFQARTWNSLQAQGNHDTVGFVGIVPSVSILQSAHTDVRPVQQLCLLRATYILFRSGALFCCSVAMYSLTFVATQRSASAAPPVSWMTLGDHFVLAVSALAITPS